MKTNSDKKVTGKELAEKYGTTSQRIREEYHAFIENEGYLPTGEEAETFFDWLDMVFSLQRRRSDDPFDGGRGAGSMGQPID